MIVTFYKDSLTGFTSFKNHRIREYLGGIDFYLEQRELTSLREIEKKDATVPSETVKTSSNKLSYEAQKKLKSLNNKLSKVEARISALEKEIAEIDVELAINYDATIAQPDFFDNYQKKKQNLEQYMEDWEAITEELERFS